MQNFRDPATGECFYVPILFNDIFKIIIAWYRLWIRGRCPECNSNKLKPFYDCSICDHNPGHPFSKAYKNIYWNSWKLKNYKQNNNAEEN